LNYGASSPIDIEVQGADPAKCRELAKNIRNAIATVPGTADVRVLQRADASYLVINVDRDKAKEAKLSPQEVILQVVAAVNSSVSIHRNFWIDNKSGNQYFVGVQYQEDPRRKLEDVLNISATGTKQDNPVKIGSLVKLEWKRGSVEVNHSDLDRVTNVLVNI